jgi:flavin-dependent dehydrogenase
MTRRVLIVGNGVSGNALAVALLRRGHPVCLVGAGRDPRGSIGEHLPPEALPLLQSLGLQGLVDDGAHLRSPGLVSCWLGPPSARDYSFSLGGDGHNLDRAIFDARLRAAADSAGVRRLRGISPAAIRRGANGWVVSPSPATEGDRVEVDLIVDATGRPAALARRLGAKRCFLDNLLALAGRYRGEDEGDARLLVESAAEGWWYALRQTSGRRVAVYMTGADRCPAGLPAREALWRREHTTAKLVGTLGPPHDLATATWDARTMVLLPQGGPGWIAVGDAAMAFDPLSAAGITKALADARALAALASDPRLTVQDVLDRLQAERRQRWRRYVAELQASYAGRAPDAGGWWRERSRWALGLDPVEPPGFILPEGAGIAHADRKDARHR